MTQFTVYGKGCLTITVAKVSKNKTFNNNNNKFTQSNLGRGPHRGTVAHVHCKVPIEYNGVPQIRPQKYPFPSTNRQTRPTYDGKWHPDPIRRFSTIHWTDRQMNRLTDRQIVHGKV